jgi:hypothetical protein
MRHRHLATPVVAGRHPAVAPKVALACAELRAPTVRREPTLERQ